MSKVSEWIKSKTVTLTAAALFITGLGNRYDWWPDDIDPADVQMGFAIFLGLFVTGTVTANSRLNGGKLWGGYGGKSVDGTGEKPE